MSRSWDRPGEGVGAGSGSSSSGSGSGVKDGELGSSKAEVRADTRSRLQWSIWGLAGLAVAVGAGTLFLGGDSESAPSKMASEALNWVELQRSVQGAEELRGILRQASTAASALDRHRVSADFFQLVQRVGVDALRASVEEEALWNRLYQKMEVWAREP